MSKSGLYAHFRSKLDLQLATVAVAGEIFDLEVLAAGRAAAPGAARVLALSEAFLSHVERGVFPGGCFFTSATAELNVRQGPLRDQVARFVAGWMSTIAAAIGEAQELGEVARDVEAGQLAFEVNALLMAANLAYLLLGDDRVLESARRGVRDRLRA